MQVGDEGIACRTMTPDAGRGRLRHGERASARLRGLRRLEDADPALRQLAGDGKCRIELVRGPEWAVSSVESA